MHIKVNDIIPLFALSYLLGAEAACIGGKVSRVLMQTDSIFWASDSESAPQQRRRERERERGGKVLHH